MNQQHQEEGDILNIPHDLLKKEKEMDKQLFSTIFAIVYNFIWALLFFLFRHYNNEECSVINQWTLYAQIFLFTFTIYKIAIELPIHWNVQKKWKNKFFEIVDYFEFAISIILLIGLTYAYFQFEDCSNLRGFVLGYLIITYTILVIYVISIITILSNKHN